MPDDTRTFSKVAKPLFKWCGGKRSLLPEIIPRVPTRIVRYFEPFVGGGALFFELASLGRIARASLNDANVRLIRTYRAIAGGPHDGTGVEEVIRKLRRMKNEPEYFARQRARDIDGEDDATVAAWMLYLNRTCFNGLYRVNKQGRFNAPFGSYENPTICNAENLRACARELGFVRKTKLTHVDFEQAVNGAREGDFVYFDPPYLPRVHGVDFTAYTSAGFGIAEHTRLRDVARALKDKGTNVLISNSGAPEVLELYASGFLIAEVRGKRTVGATEERRGHMPDLLIS
jgi:DNA adenine methylase